MQCNARATHPITSHSACATWLKNPSLSHPPQFVASSHSGSQGRFCSCQFKMGRLPCLICWSWQTSSIPVYLSSPLALSLPPVPFIGRAHSFSNHTTFFSAFHVLFPIIILIHILIFHISFHIHPLCVTTPAKRASFHMVLNYTQFAYYIIPLRWYIVITLSARWKVLCSCQLLVLVIQGVLQIHEVVGIFNLKITYLLNLAKIFTFFGNLFHTLSMYHCSSYCSCGFKLFHEM